MQNPKLSSINKVSQSTNDKESDNFHERHKIKSTFEQKDSSKDTIGLSSRTKK
jgi:hypothetical protein